MGAEDGLPANDTRGGGMEVCAIAWIPRLLGQSSEALGTKTLTFDWLLSDRVEVAWFPV